MCFGGNKYNLQRSIFVHNIPYQPSSNSNFHHIVVYCNNCYNFLIECPHHIDNYIKIRRMEPAAGFEPAWNSFAGCCVKPMRMCANQVPHTPPHWLRLYLLLGLFVYYIFVFSSWHIVFKNSMIVSQETGKYDYRILKSPE